MKASVLLAERASALAPAAGTCPEPSEDPENGIERQVLMAEGQAAPEEEEAEGNILIYDLIAHRGWAVAEGSEEKEEVEEEDEDGTRTGVPSSRPCNPLAKQWKPVARLPLAQGPAAPAAASASLADLEQVSGTRGLGDGAARVGGGPPGCGAQSGAGALALVRSDASPEGGDCGEALRPRALHSRNLPSLPGAASARSRCGRGRSLRGPEGPDRLLPAPPHRTQPAGVSADRGFLGLWKHHPISVFVLTWPSPCVKYASKFPLCVRTEPACCPRGL